MIRKAIKSDIEKIQLYIEEFRLDSDKMDCKRLLVYEVDRKLAGFGRFKDYGQYCEIATIGVIEPYRGMGIGKSIMKYLISTAPSDKLWLITVIPDYFKKFGFVKVDENIPELLEIKARQLCKNFNRPIESLIFMKLIKS